MLNLDFSNVKDSFALVDEGEHLFIVEEVSTKPTKNDPSKENLVVTASVSGSGENDGRTLVAYLPIQENTMWKIAQFFRAVSNDPEMESFDGEPEDLVGLTFIGTVEHTDSGDRTYANITAFAGTAEG
jgi:hypothetical protein